MVLLKLIKAWKYWITGGVAVLVAAPLLWFWFVLPRGAYFEIPAFRAVKNSYKESDAQLRDRHGHIIHELRVDYDGRRLEWTTLNDISPALMNAVIASEDKRFFKHSGVDVTALAHAAYGSVFSGGQRGASTITMQLASMMKKDLKPKKGNTKRGYEQKLKQMRYALILERNWSKREILEAYLNFVTFKGELAGISAASRGLFDKDTSGLDEYESLILASLIRSPNATAGNVMKRAGKLSLQMKVDGNNNELEERIRKIFEKPYTVRQAADLAPHVAYYLLKQGKKDVQCSLDGELQSFAYETLRAHLRAVRKQNVRDGAVLVIHNRTGEVLAYVANTGQESSAPYIDGIQAKRQAGSTLKPFLYALALDRRIITAASLLNDAPLNIATERGVYTPENYDKKYRGAVPVRIALASSLNVPAVRALMLVGADPFVEKLRELGFSNLMDGDHYGYSLALGAMDVNLLELTNAYRALANAGIGSTVTFIPRNKMMEKRQLYSPEASFIVSHVLSDRTARSVTFGLENPLSTRFWTSVKTGTSKDMRDNWCVGYSQLYTVGVWVGNFSGTAMWDVSGITGAAPVWNEIMNYLHREIKSSPPSPPGGLVRKRAVAGGPAAGTEEWFITGTEPVSVEARGHGRKIVKITYPPKDVIFALDPDIPPDRQRIFFEATGKDEKLQWLLNGEVIGTGKLVPWEPQRGKHMLSLTDSAGDTLDEVSFTVRD